MGGYGSGSDDYELKILVEDCLSLSVNSLREDIITTDSNNEFNSGSILWS